MKNRKLQVFVSSTFIDLQEERQAAVQAILKAGHIPAGMELFKAGDESQWEIIKSWIEESDVYMVILGGRYGSIEPTSGKSYTQLEYEYAISLKKSFFSIIVSDETTDKKAKKRGSKIEDFKEVNNLSRLNDFKDTAKTKMVSFAEDLKDIKLAVGDSLNEIAKKDNLTGWVRADDRDFSAVSEELARLSKENNELKSQLAEVNKVEKINGVEINKFIGILRLKKTGYNEWLLLLIKEFYSTNEEQAEVKYRNRQSEIIDVFDCDCQNLLQFFYLCGKFPIVKIRTEYSYEGSYGWEWVHCNILELETRSNLIVFDEQRDYISLKPDGTKLLFYLEENPHLLENLSE